MKQIADGIFKICIPFEDLYTSSFVLFDDDGYIVADSGDSAFDAEKYIIPKLEEKGIYPKYLTCSHLHGDHCGGTRALAARYPEAKVCAISKEGLVINNRVYLNDGDLLLSRYKIIALPGHSDDSMAIFDTKTKMLISFDCLQQRGVSKYGCGFDNYEKYMKSLQKVRSLNAKAIAAAHEFYPLGSMAVGENEVEEYLCECERDARFFVDFVLENKSLDSTAVAEKYNSQNPDFPTISSGSVERLLSTFEKNNS